MNEGELKLVELDPDKQYVIMFRGNAYNFRWPDKPANVSDILLNADHYTIEDLEMALEALKKGGQMDSSKEFEAELNHIRNEVDYILDDDTAGEVRITYANGHSEIKDAKVLLADDIMRIVGGSMKRAAHKATQARVREVLERLVHLRETTYKNEGLGDLDMWIDAELSKLGEQG